MMVVSGTIYHNPEIAEPVSSRRDERARRSGRSHATSTKKRATKPAQLTGTPEFERSSNERKKVEMRFAHPTTAQIRALPVRRQLRTAPGAQLIRPKICAIRPFTQLFPLSFV